MSESKMRPASDVAAEIVPDPAGAAGSWTNYIVSEKHCIEFLGWSERHMAGQDRDELREVFVDVIEQARYEGAAEALKEVARRVQSQAEACEATAERHHKNGDVDGCALETGKAQAYEGVVRLAMELASRPRTA